jgi:hypothetical protein
MTLGEIFYLLYSLTRLMSMPRLQDGSLFCLHSLDSGGSSAGKTLYVTQGHPLHLKISSATEP